MTLVLQELLAELKRQRGFSHELEKELEKLTPQGHRRLLAVLRDVRQDAVTAERNRQRRQARSADASSTRCSRR